MTKTVVTPTALTTAVQPLGGHMRFELTDEEREEIIALKKACESEGIKYRSIFELAKYCLVVRSQVDSNDPKAAEKRTALALKRMKKRRTWEANHGMSKIDNMEAIKEIEKDAPGFFVVRYAKDMEGHPVVGHHHAYSPYKYMFTGKQNLGKYLAAEQYRLDLGAADMEEARTGIAVVSVADEMWGLTGAYRYLRVITKAKDNCNDMHPNRIRRVYSEIPVFGHHLVETCKAMLPKKIADRIVIHSSVAQLEAKLVKAVEGEDPTDIVAWCERKEAIYQESVRRVGL
ncbi:expressed unknown protein [Seminavis robusta]|uniref:CRAL-TRIO domain-containing protein n=1 Tax=Seminavis robusta TaxID=568900 RepID=A0A9N8H8R7_9STRA|nr:expressed unknown protein [Seminavis robusta]|eukprot:Sro98_g050370.1 n/a (287) ;mRNA; f:37047-37907